MKTKNERNFGNDKKSKLNNFFIIGTTDQISKIMSFGKSMNLVGTKYAWYGLTLVMTDLIILFRF